MKKKSRMPQIVYCQDCRFLRYPTKHTNMGWCRSQKMWINMAVRNNCPFDCNYFKKRQKRLKISLRDSLPSPFLE